MPKTTYILESSDDPKDFIPRNSEHVEYYLYTIRVDYIYRRNEKATIKKEDLLVKSNTNNSTEVLAITLNDLCKDWGWEVTSVELLEVNRIIRKSEFHLESGRGI